MNHIFHARSGRRAVHDDRKSRDVHVVKGLCVVLPGNEEYRVFAQRGEPIAQRTPQHVQQRFRRQEGLDTRITILSTGWEKGCGMGNYRIRRR